ncbi:MAG TPA: FAD-dependent oxidoreductase, partial [Solirubrobacterales bacterium]
MNSLPPATGLETLIVGAGPAGLFAALSLAASGERDVVLIDAGPDIAERRRDSDIHRNSGGGHPDYESGVGGAGLFSDGKLCLSLDVGGHLETAVDANERSRLLAQIEGVFRFLAGDRLSDRPLNR